MVRKSLRNCCPPAAGRLSSLLQHLLAMHSFLRGSRLICWQYLRVLVSTLERSSGLAPYSVRRRSVPGSWSLRSGAICILSGSYVSPSARFYVHSQCWRSRACRRERQLRLRGSSAALTDLSRSHAAPCRWHCLAHPDTGG